MRTSSIYLLLLILMVFSSCENNETDGTEHKRDLSLAGSVTFSGYKIQADGTLNDSNLEYFDSSKSHLTIEKISDDEISLNCKTIWGESVYEIWIPKIELSGEPDNVVFKKTTVPGTISENGNEKISSQVTLDGWMKKITLQQRSSKTNADDPYLPSYNCEIFIGCNFNDKNFNLNVLSAKP